MIRKIGIRELRPGMYVRDLNCSWIVHPLFAKAFKVKSDAEVEKLIELGVSSVYIDSSMGDDAPHAATAEEVRAEVEAALEGLAVLRGDPVAAAAVPSGEERAAAAQIQHEANVTIQAVMADARLGHHVEMEHIEPTITGVVDSIFRNSGALIQLGGIRSRDQYLFAHSVNVSALLTAFARTLKLGRDITRQLGIGGMLHDIGKMRVADAILNKPDRLTEEEFEEMKRHVRYGEEILAGISWLSPISMQVAVQHHERYDGSGYPAKLQGARLSQFGQMAAIVDVYDAITSARVYHEAMAPAMAIRKLMEWSDRHFNAELVGHFVRSIGIFPLGTLVRLESGLLGIVVAHSSENLLHPVVRVIYDTRRRWKVPPRDVDLSRGEADRIIGCEEPQKWGIEPTEYFILND